MNRALLLGSSLALSACAPTIHQPGGDPTVAQTPVPAAAYASPFAGYVRVTPGGPDPWRETNDRMGRLGGPAGHMREDAPEEAPRGNDTGSAPAHAHQHDAGAAGARR